MSRRQTVIYKARSPQQAHLLRSLLAEQQIEAVVLGAALGNGLGGGALGWAASAQVAVAEDDAPRARQIALEFDSNLSSAAASGAVQQSPPEVPAMVLDAWPTCPQCDARRSTQCPICGTAGTGFKPADTGFVWAPELADAAGGSPSCSCGPGGCAPAAQQTEVPAADEAESESPAPLLMCPTCDEPFTPQYPRLCEWCGHEFPDGYEVELPQDPAEQINSRVIAVIVALLLLALAMAAYLLLIV
jgi:hypothetical protein